MTIPNTISSLTGTWSSINHLWLDPSKPARTSDATAEICHILNNQTIEISYTWDIEDQPQAGRLLIQQNQAAEPIHAVWFDSWHMAHQFMVMSGKQTDKGIFLEGSYAAPPGPDWGWQITVETQERGWKLQMFNVTPDGQATLAVESIFK